MLDVKKYIFEKLSASSELITALGSSSKIQFFYPNSFNVLPVVTYSEIGNRNELFFDDVPYADDIGIQIDIWANGPADDIANIVDGIMIGLLFTRDFAGDVPEPDTKIFHRVTRYRRTISADEID